MVVNSADQSLAEEQQQQPGSSSSNGDKNTNQSQVWMTMAQAWLTAFPDAKAVSTADVESWIDSNFTSLPTDLQSMPRSEIIDRLFSIQNYMRHPTETEVNQVDTTSDIPSYRFQRTEQWRPVYSWLETLDNDEVVTSNEIYDWLDSNPDIKEHLFSRHSRYHLMHYIKKCHVKILKKREKKKDLQQAEQPSSSQVQKSIVEIKEPLPSSSISKQLMKIPKDSDLYTAKRKEALQKYEILLELEKKLMPHFSKRQKLQ
ncbi:hypothetical protein LINPERHAP1_LOCUS23357 [Linum perenne]